MIRHLALASVLAIGSSVILVPSIKAQTATENIPFTASVPGFCELDNVMPGNLTPDTNPATALSSLAPGGVSGSVELTCNSASKVEVTDVIKLGGPALSPLNTATSLNGVGNATINNAGPVVDQLIEVDLRVGQGGALFPPGNYQFEVEVTATAM